MTCSDTRPAGGSGPPTAAAGTQVLQGGCPALPGPLRRRARPRRRSAGNGAERSLRWVALRMASWRGSRPGSIVSTAAVTTGALWVRAFTARQRRSAPSTSAAAARARRRAAAGRRARRHDVFGMAQIERDVRGRLVARRRRGLEAAADDLLQP